MAKKPPYPPLVVGMTFGRLVVVDAKPAGKASDGRYVYRCRCVCGSSVEVCSRSLYRGLKRSCGCLARELTGKRSAARVKHGMCGTPTYETWRSMLRRCLTPSNEFFDRYGGRGITVCDRWRGRDGFAHFLADMGEKPPGLTIDRIDNDGNYEPGNCRWATPTEQVRNSTTVRLNAESAASIKASPPRSHRAQENVGRALGVSPKTVRDVVYGRTWKDIAPG